jgi:hypothetical protein
MSSSTSFNSLSGVVSSQLNYTYKVSEELGEDSIYFSNGLAYNKYALLSNLKDAAISKNNIVFLTDSVELSSCFKETQSLLTFATMPSLLYLKQANGSLYIGLNGNDAVGKTLEDKIPLFVVLVEPNKVELRTSKYERLEVSKSYPYKVYKATKATTDEQLSRQRFEIDVADKKLTIKATTADGFRFLAFDCFSNLTATGLAMNNVSVNDYLFEAEPISRSELMRGMSFDMEQIKYFNQFESFGNKKNVFIQDSEKASTHWLVTTTLEQLVNNTENVNVNIMPLKTNFTPAGTFLTKPNE